MAGLGLAGRVLGAALRRCSVGHCADSYREPPLSVHRFRRRQLKRRRLARREGHHADDFSPQRLSVLATGIEDMVHHDVPIDPGRHHAVLDRQRPCDQQVLLDAV